jgi:hypothetical protein
MKVLPYPHALCLKQRPPAYPLPGEAIDLGRTTHVPVASLPGAALKSEIPLGGVFLLQRPPGSVAPALRSVGPAEAAAKLYVTALNALAHTDRGLDAVMGIAERVPCFEVSVGDLPATCTLIRSAIGSARASRRLRSTGS